MRTTACKSRPMQHTVFPVLFVSRAARGDARRTQAADRRGAALRALGATIGRDGPEGWVVSRKRRQPVWRSAGGVVWRLGMKPRLRPTTPLSAATDRGVAESWDSRGWDEAWIGRLNMTGSWWMNPAALRPPDEWPRGARQRGRGKSLPINLLPQTSKPFYQNQRILPQFRTKVMSAAGAPFVTRPLPGFGRR